MKQKVLFYNLSENKINKFASVLMPMGISKHKVVRDELNKSVCHIASPDEYENSEHNDKDVENINAEIMVFCGMNNKSINHILGIMKRRKLNVNIKAMLTETNMNWSFAELISEISSEHGIMNKQK